MGLYLRAERAPGGDGVAMATFQFDLIAPFVQVRQLPEGHDLAPSTLLNDAVAVRGYDATVAVLQAIASVGRPDRAAIVKETLATREYDGALGRWSFDEFGDIDLMEITRVQLIEGRFQYVGTCRVSRPLEERLRAGADPPFSIRGSRGAAFLLLQEVWPPELGWPRRRRRCD